MVVSPLPRGFYLGRARSAGSMYVKNTYSSTPAAIKSATIFVADMLFLSLHSSGY
jgi:hypothetical protein